MSASVFVRVYPNVCGPITCKQHVEWSLGSMLAATQDWGGGCSIMYRGELGGTPLAL